MLSSTEDIRDLATMIANDLVLSTQRIAEILQVEENVLMSILTDHYNLFEYQEETLTLQEDMTYNLTRHQMLVLIGLIRNLWNEGVKTVQSSRLIQAIVLSYSVENHIEAKSIEHIWA